MVTALVGLPERVPHASMRRTICIPSSTFPNTTAARASPTSLGTCGASVNLRSVRRRASCMHSQAGGGMWCCAPCLPSSQAQGTVHRKNLRTGQHDVRWLPKQGLARRSTQRLRALAAVGVLARVCHREYACSPQPQSAVVSISSGICKPNSRCGKVAAELGAGHSAPAHQERRACVGSSRPQRWAHRWTRRRCHRRV